MLVIVVDFRLRPGDAARFLERVRRQAADSLGAEPGCRRFDVCTDPADPARVLLYEIYDDDAAFAAHLASAHFLAFDAEVADWVAEKSVTRLALVS